ncbi:MULTISPECIES: hypothetical protein [Terrisporobacter]|uniref:Uncharacterized protein n=1 Tax=Terrisporobacter muris TaxID=2963284 RepID=A0A9X2M9H8_9FIRM|nr:MULTISPECIES: hypothetical protein [Terrisporobacter]MCC3669630.1 hypothetical protein [Terrisporobacter mayombei]MCR1821830.1 hypothetical protein [Terrisporobacter muris]MDY3374233.1 hypothetical protein [Terrisporobacter othiniensis]
MKKYIIPGVLIILSGMLIYQTYSLNTIKEELENIKNTNASLQGDIGSLSDELSSQIQSIIHEELGKSYLTKDISFKLNKNTDKGYDLTARVELSELKGNSNVLFMYKAVNSNEWKELELKKDKELSYAGEFTLLYDDDYEYKIVIKGDKTESSDVEELAKYMFMPASPDVSWSYNDDGIYLNAYPYVEDELEQTSDENKIKTIEIIVNNNKEKTYKCEYKEESMYDENDEVMDESKYYEANIPKEAYNDKVNSIKIKVTYESGIVNIEDVTNKQAE